MEKTILKKNAKGYGYNYTDLSAIHEYLEENNFRYYQYIEVIDCNDYIMTVKINEKGEESKAIRGCRVVQATNGGGKSNPAQEQGSALTYARRYSLLLAYGLSTTDDDAQCLTKTKTNAPTRRPDEEFFQAIADAKSDDELKAIYEQCRAFDQNKQFYDAIVSKQRSLNNK